MRAGHRPGGKAVNTSSAPLLPLLPRPPPQALQQHQASQQKASQQQQHQASQQQHQQQLLPQTGSSHVAAIEVLVEVSGHKHGVKGAKCFAGGEGTQIERDTRDACHTQRVFAPDFSTRIGAEASEKLSVLRLRDLIDNFERRMRKLQHEEDVLVKCIDEAVGTLGGAGGSDRQQPLDDPRASELVDLGRRIASLRASRAELDAAAPSAAAPPLTAQHAERRLQVWKTMLQLTRRFQEIRHELGLGGVEPAVDTAGSGGEQREVSESGLVEALGDGTDDHPRLLGRLSYSWLSEEKQDGSPQKR